MVTHLFPYKIIISRNLLFSFFIQIDILLCLHEGGPILNSRYFNSLWGCDMSTRRKTIFQIPRVLFNADLPFTFFREFADINRIDGGYTFTNI